MISMFHYSLHSSDGIGKGRTTGLPLTLAMHIVSSKKFGFYIKKCLIYNRIKGSRLWDQFSTKYMAIFVLQKVDIEIHNVAD